MKIVTSLLRGPDPVSKYEKRESSSSGQKRESRLNLAAAVTQTQTRQRDSEKDRVFCAGSVRTYEIFG